MLDRTRVGVFYPVSKKTALRTAVSQMALTFENAPLIETVAEVRWEPSLNADQNNGAPFIFGNESRHEEFFMRFSGEVFQNGFRKSERLVPPDFPLRPYQPVFRFRHESRNELYQVGIGLFSTNALPPYLSWEKFEPTLIVGIQALLSARSAEETNKPFRLVLRYINGFRRPDHTGDISPEAFMRDVLGIGLRLPAAITRHIHGSDSEITSAIEASLNVSESLKMTVKIGPGVARGAGQALILDMAIRSRPRVAAKREELLKTFRSAHDIEHDVFVQLTERAKANLRPKEV